METRIVPMVTGAPILVWWFASLNYTIDGASLDYSACIYIVVIHHAFQYSDTARLIRTAGCISVFGWRYMMYDIYDKWCTLHWERVKVSFWNWQYIFSVLLFTFRTSLFLAFKPVRQIFINVNHYFSVVNFTLRTIFIVFIWRFCFSFIALFLVLCIYSYSGAF